MRYDKQQNLFYKKKSRTRYAIIAVLALTTLLGIAVLKLGETPDWKDALKRYLEDLHI